jgi:hypothetical protein
MSHQGHHQQQQQQAQAQQQQGIGQGGIPLSQPYHHSQALNLDQDDLFSSYLGPNGNGFNQQLFVDTVTSVNTTDTIQAVATVDTFNASTFYDNSPQYPTHFIPQQQSQQFVNMINFPQQSSQPEAFHNNSNTFQANQQLQGSYDGLPISGANQQTRMYNMANQQQPLQQQTPQQSFSPTHMHQSASYNNHQQIQYQKQLQQQQQQHQQQQQLLLQRQLQRQQELQRQEQRIQLQQQQHMFRQNSTSSGSNIHLAQQQQYRAPQQHQQVVFQQQHQQYSPIPSSKAAAKKRSSRAASKRKVKYEESSEEEDDVIEDHLQDDDDDEDDVVPAAELSDDSDFDMQPSTTAKQQKKAAAAAAAATGDAPVVMIPMATKTFEKMLDYRLNTQTGQPELLVKYKFASYHHVEWVPQSKIEGEHLGKHRVKKFLTKWHQDGQRGEDFSEYLKVDRIIDEGELADPVTGEPSIFYLVKWNGLFYDASTWESEEDVQKVLIKTSLTESNYSFFPFFFFFFFFFLLLVGYVQDS